MLILHGYIVTLMLSDSYTEFTSPWLTLLPILVPRPCKTDKMNKSYGAIITLLLDKPTRYY